MSLLPARFQTSDDMPMSLGKAIAAAIAPKVDPIEAFNKGDHGAPAWIGYDMAVSGSEKTIRAEYSLSGNTVTIRGTVAAPPSVQKFRVGDKFRVKEVFAYLFPINEFVANQVDGDEVWAIDPNAEKNGFFLANSIELISPASETETEGDGWIEWCGGERPVAIDALVHIKYPTSEPSGPILAAKLRWNWVFNGKDGGDIIAYRVVKP